MVIVPADLVRPCTSTRHEHGSGASRGRRPGSGWRNPARGGRPASCITPR